MRVGSRAFREKKNEKACFVCVCFFFVFLFGEGPRFFSWGEGLYNNVKNCIYLY